MVQTLETFLTTNLNELKDNGLYNEIDIVEGANGAEINIGGKSYINLSSNNYLGLATDEDLKKLLKTQSILMVLALVQYVLLMGH